MAVLELICLTEGTCTKQWWSKVTVTPGPLRAAPCSSNTFAHCAVLISFGLSHFDNQLSHRASPGKQNLASGSHNTPEQAECKTWAVATAEASFHQEELEHATAEEVNWDPATHSSRVQLCNCCHKWTNTHQNNITKTFLFHPLVQTFIESLRRTPNLSVLKNYFGFSFWGLSLAQMEGWRVVSQDRGAPGWLAPHPGTGQGQVCHLILGRTGPGMPPQPAAATAAFKT